MTRERSNRSHWLHCLQPSHMAPILSVCESACTRETPVKGGSTKTTPASQLILWPCAYRVHTTTFLLWHTRSISQLCILAKGARMNPRNWKLAHGIYQTSTALLEKVLEKKPLQTWPQKQKCLFPPEPNAPWATGNGLEREATANMRKSLSIQSLQARENNCNSTHYTVQARELHFKSYQNTEENAEQSVFGRKGVQKQMV